MKYNYPFLLKFAYLLLVLVPILDLYVTIVPFVTLGEIALIIGTIIIYFLSYKQNIIFLKRWISLFFAYAIVATVLLMPFNAGRINFQTLKEFVGWLIYAILFFVLVERINVERFLNAYVKIAIIASLFLCVQYFVFMFTDRWIPGIIPGLESSVGASTNDLIKKIARPSSFFSEPAHFAQYLSIPFCYLIFKTNKKEKDWFSIFLFALSLFFNRSGNGLIVLLVVVLCFLIRLWKKRQYALVLFLITCSVIIAASLLRTNEYFQSTVSRLDEISGNGGPGTYSGYIRIVRGYIGFLNLNPLSQLFGLGIGVYHDVFATDLYKVLSEKTDLIIDYVNGAQYYLLSTGIIGTGVLLCCLLKCIFKSKDFLKVSCSLLLIILMLIAALYTSWLWLYFLIVIFAEPKKIIVQQNESLSAELVMSRK